MELRILDSQLIDLLFERLILLQHDPQFAKFIHPDGDPCADTADTVLKRNNDIAYQFIRQNSLRISSGEESI